MGYCEHRSIQSRQFASVMLNLFMSDTRIINGLDYRDKYRDPEQ